MLNAILYWLNTGIPWRDLPERFGAWQSVYSWFRAWTKAGVWEDILTALIVQDLVDETTLMLDSTTIKAHQHASGVKKGDTTRKPDGAEGLKHSVKFCVSDFRQSQVWCCGNSAESGLKPFHTYGPGGWGGMRAGGVNAVPNAGTV